MAVEEGGDQVLGLGPLDDRPHRVVNRHPAGQHPHPLGGVRVAEHHLDAPARADRALEGGVLPRLAQDIGRLPQDVGELEQRNHGERGLAEDVPDEPLRLDEVRRLARHADHDRAGVRVDPAAGGNLSQPAHHAGDRLVDPEAPPLLPQLERHDQAGEDLEECREPADSRVVDPQPRAIRRLEALDRLAQRLDPRAVAGGDRRQLVQRALERLERGDRHRATRQRDVLPRRPHQPRGHERAQALARQVEGCLGLRRAHAWMAILVAADPRAQQHLVAGVGQRDELREDRVGEEGEQVAGLVLDGRLGGRVGADPPRDVEQVLQLALVERPRPGQAIDDVVLRAAEEPDVLRRARLGRVGGHDERQPRPVLRPARRVDPLAQPVRSVRVLAYVDEFEVERIGARQRQLPVRRQILQALARPVERRLPPRCVPRLAVRDHVPAHAFDDVEERLPLRLGHDLAEDRLHRVDGGGQAGGEVSGSGRKLVHGRTIVIPYTCGHEAPR